MADNNHIQADRYRRSVKSCDDKLTRCVNNLDMRLSRELRSSNDMARRQGEGGRINNVPINLQLENIDKKLNDMQDIVDAASESRCFSNGNVSQPTIDYLRTFKTSVMKNVRDVISTTCETFLLGTIGTARATTFGMKRGHAKMERAEMERADEKRDDVELNANERHSAKRRKTRHDGEETRTVAATNNNASSSTTMIARTKTSERKSHLSAVVGDELNWYYERGVFATRDLFRFMTRTIVHRLMDTALLPNDYAVKSTIRRMMPKRRITSQNEILRLLHPFYRL